MRQAFPSALASWVSTPRRHGPAARQGTLSQSELSRLPTDGCSQFLSVGFFANANHLPAKTRGKSRDGLANGDGMCQPAARRGRYVRVPRRHRDRAECGDLFNLYLPGPRQLRCCETVLFTADRATLYRSPRPLDYRPRSGPTAPMVPIHDRIPVTPEPTNQLRFGSTGRCSAQRVPGTVPSRSQRPTTLGVGSPALAPASAIYHPQGRDPPLHGAWGSAWSWSGPLRRRRPEDLTICPGSDPELKPSARSATALDKSSGNLKFREATLARWR